VNGLPYAADFNQSFVWTIFEVARSLVDWPLKRISLWLCQLSSQPIKPAFHSRERFVSIVVALNHLTKSSLLDMLPLGLIPSK
jgi:hypothetical protein